jgi:hypothetical protein
VSLAFRPTVVAACTFATAAEHLRLGEWRTLEDAPAIGRYPKNGLRGKLMPPLSGDRTGQCSSSKNKKVALLRWMPTGPERLVRLSCPGSSGRSPSSKVAFRYAQGCWRLGGVRGVSASSNSPDVFAFFPRPSTTSRGQTRPTVLVAGKSLMFQYAWHCLIYSGAYLFQFARHTALLLKTSSALPAHHCIRQARSAGLDASPIPAIPIPSHGAHCSSRWYRLIFDDQAGWSSATVYALRAHRLRGQLYSNHPLSIASLLAMLLAMQSDTDTVVSAGQRSHFLYPGAFTCETVSKCGYSGPYSALRIVSLG